jgi:hypothetical protein
MKWLAVILVLLALLCIAAPVSAVTNGTIWWTDKYGRNITSATMGDTVYFQFDTGIGGHSHTPPPYDYYIIAFYYKDAKSGEWRYMNPGFPSFRARWIGDINGTYQNYTSRAVTYPLLSDEVNVQMVFRNSPPADGNIVTYDNAFASYFYPPYTGKVGEVCFFGANPSEPFSGAYYQWRGISNPITIPEEVNYVKNTDKAYKVQFMAYSFPARWNDALCNNWTMYAGDDINATLTINPKVDYFSGLGDILQDIGGDGMRFLAGVIICIVMGVLPFFILHRFNVYISIMMMLFGVGIAFAAGLFDLPVIFALALGSLAIYLLIYRGSGGGGA